MWYYVIFSRLIRRYTRFRMYVLSNACVWLMGSFGLSSFVVHLFLTSFPVTKLLYSDRIPFFRDTYCSIAPVYVADRWDGVCLPSETLPDVVLFETCWTSAAVSVRSCSLTVKLGCRPIEVMLSISQMCMCSLLLHDNVVLSCWIVYIIMVSVYRAELGFISVAMSVRRST